MSSSVARVCEASTFNTTSNHLYVAGVARLIKKTTATSRVDMAAPSFSSFPPSFSSFPDIDPGPSSRPARRDQEKDREREREKERKHHKRHKRDDNAAGDEKRKKKRHKEDEHREGSAGKGARRKSRSRSRSRSRTRHGRHMVEDDERRKREEDRGNRRDDAERPSAREGLVYFTDRKGDPLNVRYGGLYAGDVPRYRLVECELFHYFTSDN